MPHGRQSWATNSHFQYNVYAGHVAYKIEVILIISLVLLEIDKRTQPWYLRSRSDEGP